ncbi:MAG TPA: aminotransferase class V-fold PLP-dependent enzyme [Clostridia bacterium]|nr:aminotransferase class V-fold PLP-dependent enzyme [Clostridia bacterium]
MVEAYLDNAATSRQKPAAVWSAMEEYFHRNNCNPGRSGYELALEAGRKVLDVREKLAAFFHVGDPHRVIFTQNITVALNFALKGLLNDGDHVLITGLEHNAVVRPLKSLSQERNVSYSIMPTDPRGFIDLAAVPEMIRPNTKMIVATHASNVMGTLVPVEELGRIARQAGLDFVVDTAQTAGCFPLDITRIGATVLAFTGHKHLLGPVGTGGFVLTEEAAARMKPLYEGGTGSVSDREEQPDFAPDRFESGTLNALGIVGLGGALDYLTQVGLDRIRAKEEALTRRLLAGLAEIPGVVVYGPRDAARQTGTVALNIQEVDNAELAYVLDQKYRIMTRPGLHCAPVAHRTMGTFPEGVLRVSIGHFTTEEEIDYFLSALGEIVRAVSR